MPNCGLQALISMPFSLICNATLFMLILMSSTPPPPLYYLLSLLKRPGGIVILLAILSTLHALQCDKLHELI